MEHAETGEPVIEGWAVCKEDQLHFEIADEAVKLGPQRLTDALTRMMTLSTAMVGGSLGLLKDDVCQPVCRVIGAGLFFGALFFAAYGAIPFGSRCERELGALKAEFERVLSWKRRWLHVSCGCLLAGSLAIVIGAALKLRL